MGSRSIFSCLTKKWKEQLQYYYLVLYSSLDRKVRFSGKYRIFRHTRHNFVPQKQLCHVHCALYEGVLYEICLAEVEKFVKIKNLVLQY
jgi:hypothetical protein